MKYLILLSLFITGCNNLRHADLSKARYGYLDTFHVDFEGYYKNCSGDVRVERIFDQYKGNAEIVYEVSAWCENGNRGNSEIIWVRESELPK